MSADASTINHEEAASIARGLGNTYTSPSDAAVRTVFAAYLELHGREAETERMQRDASRFFDAAGAMAKERNELAEQVETLKKELDAATSPVPGLAESGPYTLADVEAIEQHRGKPYARLRATVMERDDAVREINDAKQQALTDDHRHERDMQALGEDFAAAKADVARLREHIQRIHDWIDHNGEQFDDTPEGRCDREEDCEKCGHAAALAATSSAEWLAQHDAEVRAKLVEDARRHFGASTADGATPETVEGGIAAAAFEAWVAAHDAETRADMEKAIEAQAESIRMYAAKVEALEAQLAAATNDAARAELRARDAVEELRVLEDTIDAAQFEGVLAHSDLDHRREVWNRRIEISRSRAQTALAAAPDSDARLREVMLKVGFRVKAVCPAMEDEVVQIVDAMFRGDS